MTDQQTDPVTADRTTPEADVTLGFDDTEALYAVLVRHRSFNGECDEHEEWDCRGEVYAEVERIVAARLAAQAAPAPAPAEQKEHAPLGNSWGAVMCPVEVVAAFNDGPDGCSACGAVISAPAPAEPKEGNRG